MNFHDSPLLLQHLFNIKVKNSSDQKHHMPEVHEIRVLHEEKDSFCVVLLTERDLTILQACLQFYNKSLFLLYIKFSHR